MESVDEVLEYKTVLGSQHDGRYVGEEILACIAGSVSNRIDRSAFEPLSILPFMQDAVLTVEARFEQLRLSNNFRIIGPRTYNSVLSDQLSKFRLITDHKSPESPP